MKSFVCDRCGNAIMAGEVVTITLSIPVIEPGNEHHLCRDCASALADFLRQRELAEVAGVRR